MTGNNGNIATQTNNATSGRTETYTYDPLNRLLTAQAQATSPSTDCWGQSFGNGGPPSTMAADALANLFYTSSIKCSSPAPQYPMDPANNNRFTGTGISYDSAGDMTADTAYAYTYDAESRIRSVAVGGTYYCYLYDGNGLRVEKATASSSSCSSPTGYELYWRNIAGNTIAETDGSGSTTNASYHEYIFFAGRRIAQSNPNATPASVYYYFADHLGSTRVVTTAVGSPCYEADFLPYGTENTPAGFANTCSTNYKFTAYERDAETAYGTSSGNDYAFARYYNSRLGRFMSGDPLDGDIGDPQTLNKYAYVKDNPVNSIDPTGLSGCGEYNYWCFPDAWGAGNGGTLILIPQGGDYLERFKPPATAKPASQVKPPAPKPQKCFKPTKLQQLGIAAQAWLANITGHNIGIGAGGSVGAGMIAFGWSYGVSRQMIVSPNGNAALVTTFSQSNVGPMPGLVRGVGAYGGFQGSVGSPTTSPDQLRANTIDFAAGGGNGLGGGGDFAISGDGSWQATGTVGAGIYGYGGAATVQFSSVLPACKE